ncbi:hypothetical protein [Pseudomonas sp.]|uniref:hypothetical protein n=1 Tax=Pseudomonas sp. TaxID=306 RepID=UPI0027362D53|nr:hypothetical protein [Pseudomonas sp.]MDP3814571.1 hypothetical protein [Pseudomonas sp.]
MKKAIRVASLLLITACALPAQAKFCTQPTALGAGMTWIQTATAQPVSFTWYGGINRVRLYESGSVVVYDGPPISSWNSTGMLGLQVEATPNARVDITTDFAMPLPGCM